MTRDTFNSLVAELDRSWSDQPRGLLRETLAWVVLGYLVLLAALFMCALLFAVGLYVAVKFHGPTWTFVAAVAALLGSLASVLILGSLWVRFVPPEGITLDEASHPELHRVIRETSRAAGGIHLHQVLLDPELNASAVQNPRLGVFGWYRTYLVIGLPLMEALSPEEFRAVLAHELAHVSGPDGRLRSWLHRTRMTWERIVGQISASRFCPGLSKFFHWFWPRFNSRAFLLSRYHELEADRVSAEAVSAEALASGLRRLAIQASRLDEQIWQPLELAIPGRAELPADVMSQVSSLVRSVPEAAEEERWAAQALGKTTGLLDQHPALSDRLSRLGQGEPLPGLLVPDHSAAAEFLAPEFVASARSRFSAAWLAGALVSRKSLGGSSNAAAEYRAVLESWKRIASLSRIDGLEKLQPEIVKLLERRPDHAGALFLRGSHLAEKGQKSSTMFLEKAASDPTLAVKSYETMARYYLRFGDPDAAKFLEARADRHEREMREALIERGRVSKGDSFLPHDLGETELELLREVLATDPAIRRVWLGAREVKHFPRWRHLVLVVEQRWPAFKPVSERMQQQLLTRVAERWEVDAFVQPLRYDEGTKPILRALRRQVADSEVYRRR